MSYLMGAAAHCVSGTEPEAFLVTQVHKTSQFFTLTEKAYGTDPTEVPSDGGIPLPLASTDWWKLKSGGNLN